ncbi:MAG: branched-chain amino acid transport system permease protein livM [Solirubrobacteraceae bacterium]
MSQVVLFALLGLGTGALIAGIGLGVVLTYRGSGVINVATGAVAMAAGYAFYSLRTVVDTPVALVGTLAFTIALGLAIELLAFRPLRASSPLARLVASLGVLLTLQAGATLIYGTGAKPAPSVLPRNTVQVTDVAIPADRFWITGIVIVIAIALAAAYRFTRFGLATRAASESEESAILAGLGAKELSIANTVLGAVIAGGIGVLAASLAQLDATTLPLQVVPALGAVLFARFTSFGITCVAGLLIGVLQSLLYYASTQSWFPTDKGAALPGISSLLTFVIIVIALYVRGSSLPTRGELVEQRLPAVPRPERLARPAIACAVAGAVALVVLPYDYRNALIISMAGMTICLSYVVITGFVGQVSLMQVALAGAAGFVVSHLAKDAGIGFPLGAIAGTLAATALGFVAGASALRVRGVSLAVITLAAAVAIEQFGFANSTWGAGATGSPVPELELAGLDLGPRASFRGLDGDVPSPILGFVVLAVVVALGLLVASLRRSGLGKRMLAVRSNERAAAAAGINVRHTKFAAYAISSFIAGIGGTLYGYSLGSVSAERFGILIALGFVAFAYVGGITMVSGAVFGGLIATSGLVPHVFEAELGISGTWTLLVAGITLILNLVLFPDGVAGSRYQKKQLAAAKKASGGAAASGDARPPAIAGTVGDR